MTTFTAILIATVIVALSVLILRNFEKRRGKHGRLPPGNVGWPGIGSAFSFFKPHSTNIEQQLAKHGKIFTKRFIGSSMIISADPDLNKFVVQNQASLFENHLPPQIQALFGDNNLLFLAGEQFKHLKSTLLSFFNSWEIQTSFLEHVQKASDQILNPWRHKNIVLVTQETKRFAFNIIAEKAIGLDSEDPETEQLLREFVVLHDGLQAPQINLPKTRYRKALKARENIVKIISKRVEEERKKMEDNENMKPTDLIGWHLKNNVHESVEDICSSVVGIVVSGVFNLASTIDLAIYFLANCPQALQEMREEYLQILRGKKDRKEDCDDKLTWDDYKSMKFSQYVINETLRIGNVFPGLAKKATKDVQFKGYVIPKGFSVMLYTAAMHLDPTTFERPKQFDPWRWQSIKNTNSWMPFGGGVHYCLGAEIARIEIVIFLHRFLFHYKWELAEPDHPIAKPSVFFPKGLPVKVYSFDGSV